MLAFILDMLLIVRTECRCSMMTVSTHVMHTGVVHLFVWFDCDSCQAHDSCQAVAYHCNMIEVVDEEDGAQLLGLEAAWQLHQQVHACIPHAIQIMI